MFSEILERFIKDSTISFMVLSLLENLLNADKIDRWLEGVCQTQYTKEILWRILAFIEFFNTTLAKPFRWTYIGKPLLRQVIQSICRALY